MVDSIITVLNKYIDVFGFVSVDEYKQKRNELELDDHFDDYTFLDNYKTIITLALPYPSNEVKWNGKGYGILSRYSYGVDYHVVFRGILNKINEDFNNLGIKSFGSVDVSKVDERFAGYLSNLGFLGKNQFLINPEYGSYMYLATILVDIDMDTPKIVLDDCHDCNICVEACPSGALDNGFDENKCISSLSQMKKAFDETEISYFKTMIYGCDICQKVCPKNIGIDIHKYQEFEPSGIENIDIKNLLKMSNKEYLSVYKKNASSWKGSTIIKRNALCLIANQNLKEYSNEIRKSMVKFSGVLWYNKTAELVLKILERE
jgi:epoxyqueuosine reductase